MSTGHHSLTYHRKLPVTFSGLFNMISGWSAYDSHTVDVAELRGKIAEDCCFLGFLFFLNISLWSFCFHWENQLLAQSTREEESTGQWMARRRATIKVVCHQWVLKYHKCLWLTVSVNMARGRERRRWQCKLCKSLSHSSPQRPQDCVERYCRSDTSWGTCCPLLMDSGTAAFTPA